MKRIGLWMALAVTLALSLALAGCKPAEPAVMSLMAFAGYAEDAWVKPFEEANKCTVKINYSGQVDEMFNRPLLAAKRALGSTHVGRKDGAILSARVPHIR